LLQDVAKARQGNGNKAPARFRNDREAGAAAVVTRWQPRNENKMR